MGKVLKVSGSFSLLVRVLDLESEDNEKLGRHAR